MTDISLGLDAGESVLTAGQTEAEQALIDATPGGHCYWTPQVPLVINRAALVASRAFDDKLDIGERHRRFLVAAFLTQFGLVR